MDDQENIERFFDKETSEKERSNLKQKIRNEQDEDANIILEVGESIKEEEELSNLRGRLKEIAEDGNREGKQVFFPFFKVAATVAIIAVISILIWKYVPFSRKEDVFDDYFKPYSGAVIARGENSISPKGIEYYQASKFGNALSEFLKVQNKNNTLNLLIANCYLSLGDLDESIRWLNTIESSEPSLILQSRDWYLALAYLKMDKVSESRKILIDLAESGSIYKDQASKLLTEPSYQK